MEIGCLVVVLLMAAVFVIGIAAYFINLQRINKQLSDAYYAYMGCLADLKQRPYDPNLRERALQAGRHYSNLTRSNKGVTIFDEMALANDLNAACAGAAQPAHSPEVIIPPIEERLARLKKLLDSGTINEDEYRARRGKLLDEA
jgi:putative oligomerization/nucleic acid binding protein